MNVVQSTKQNSPSNESLLIVTCSNRIHKSEHQAFCGAVFGYPGFEEMTKRHKKKKKEPHEDQMTSFKLHRPETQSIHPWAQHRRSSTPSRSQSVISSLSPRKTMDRSLCSDWNPLLSFQRSYEFPSRITCDENRENYAI
jgi:hypothetical protein